MENDKPWGMDMTLLTHAMHIASAFAIPKEVFDADQHGSYAIAKHQQEIYRFELIATIQELIGKQSNDAGANDDTKR